MPDKFKINKELDLMEIYSYGIVTAVDIEESIAKAQAAYEEYGINKLLVDTKDQQKMPGTVSIFKIFSSFPRHISLAIIADKKQVTVDDIIFGENVAVNRGIRMQVFYDREAALKWLKEVNL
jgi:hypothetical protein